MTKDLEFLDAKSDTVDNLKAIQVNLIHCVDEGMLDLEDEYYNQILSFIDEASISENWAELMEVVDKAKILEVDVAVWLSSHGRNSLSLPWPRVPKKSE